MVAPFTSTATSGRRHLPTIQFRMLYTVEHLPMPVSFPGSLITKTKPKNPTIGVAEHFRDASFPRRAVSQNRNTKEAAVGLYMIHLFKTNYQQKERQYPKATERKSSVSKLFLNSHYLPTWQH